jgi:hypothetical protein
MVDARSNFIVDPPDPLTKDPHTLQLMDCLLGSQCTDKTHWETWVERALHIPPVQHRTERNEQVVSNHIPRTILRRPQDLSSIGAHKVDMCSKRRYCSPQILYRVGLNRCLDERKSWPQASPCRQIALSLPTHSTAKLSLQNVITNTRNFQTRASASKFWRRYRTPLCCHGG